MRSKVPRRWLSLVRGRSPARNRQGYFLSQLWLVLCETMSDTVPSTKYLQAFVTNRNKNENPTDSLQLSHGPPQVTPTFIDLDGHSWLVVRSCGEDLRLLCGNNSVSWDQLGHDPSNSLNAKSQGTDIEQHQVTWNRSKAWL